MRWGQIQAWGGGSHAHFRSCYTTAFFNHANKCLTFFSKTTWKVKSQTDLTNSCTCVISHVQLCVVACAVALQAPLSMGFLRQEYWMVCHFLHQSIVSVQGLNPCPLHWQVDSLPLVLQRNWWKDVFTYLFGRVKRRVSRLSGGWECCMEKKPLREYWWENKLVRLALPICVSCRRRFS